MFCRARNGAFALPWGAPGLAGEGARAEHGSWHEWGVSGCSNCVFLIEFRELQYCNTWDSTARSRVTFRSRIHSAQLQAGSDPAAAACSWRRTSCICRGESPSSARKLTPRKKKKKKPHQNSFFWLDPCPRQTRWVAGWARGAAEFCRWEVWLKLGREAVVYGDGTRCQLPVWPTGEEEEVHLQPWGSVKERTSPNERGLCSLDPSVGRKITQRNLIWTWWKFPSFFFSMVC